MLLGGGTIQTPTSQNNVRLSLVNGPGAPPILPAGITALKYFRVVLTIDGIEHDASFWSASTDKQGLNLVVVVNSQDVPPGTLGLLFDVSSGNAVRVGSSSLSALSQGVASAAMISQKVIRAQSGSGSSQMQFSPGQTGSYAAGGASPGTGPAPAGAFWCEFNVPDPGCVTVGSTNICGEKKVESVEITELSTEEILADCYFGESDAGASGVIPPGYQFWCQRTLKPDGSTDIKISSMQANLPIIRAKIVRASDNLPMFWTYHQAIGGLHTPDGVQADPYQKKEWQFAGFKKLTYTTKEDEDYSFYIDHAVQPLKDAGYTAYSKYFKKTNPGFIGEVSVYDTLDGRVLIEDDVIKKEEKKWRVVSGEATQGNRGMYEYVGKTYEGTATAVLTWPSFPQFKVWEITANVVFEKDKALSTKDMDVYKATGTLTQTVYTTNPGPCSYTPGSFTDTYQIYGGEQGDLWIKAGSDPVEYLASATIDSRTPLQSHSYTECCPTGPGGALECTTETLEPGEQEHMWLMTALGGSFTTGQPDGRLKGTFQHVTPQGINGTLYEWDFAPTEKK
jgi:hypothetical protein